MAASGATPPLVTGGIGCGHRILVVGSLGTDKVRLGACMRVVAYNARERSSLAGMDIMKVLYSVTESGRLCSLFQFHKTPIMALEAELGYFKPEQLL